jgi:endonuclease/exonuclease/phosphatase family metal-dependent hydrolase
MISSCNGAKQPDAGQTIRLITHNVYYGFTKTPERKTAWLNWMKNQRPDIISLQELNEYTPEQLAEDARFWNHHYSVLLKQEGFPTGVTSRYPIEDIQRYTEGFHHGLIRVKIKGVYFYIIHLHPSNWEIRHLEIDQILKEIGTLPKESLVFLAGDFNTLAPTDSIFYTHGRLEPFFAGLDKKPPANNLNEGRLDYNVIRKITEAGLVDLEYRHRPEDYVFTGSFPARLPTEGQHGDLRRLDYIFYRKSPKILVLDTRIIANDTTQYLSDHLPVIADMILKP